MVEIDPLYFVTPLSMVNHNQKSCVNYLGFVIITILNIAKHLED